MVKDLRGGAKRGQGQGTLAIANLVMHDERLNMTMKTLFTILTTAMLLLAGNGRLNTSLLSIFVFITLGQQQCSQSELVEDIPRQTTCHGSRVTVSVIFRPPSLTDNCSSLDEDYHIVVYHHDSTESLNIPIQKHPPPERYNETACLVHLTLSNGVSVTDHNDTLLQVFMTPSGSLSVYCSNNFTLLVDTGNYFVYYVYYYYYCIHL